VCSFQSITDADAAGFCVSWKNCVFVTYTYVQRSEMYDVLLLVLEYV